jgi:hypothetical protein
VVESQQIQPTGEQLSIVNWWWMCWSSMVELCMSIQCQCIFTMFIPASFFFIIKLYSPNLDWVGGSWNKFGKIRWALKFLSTS